MEWQIIVALVVAVPVIMFPVAFVWFLNLGGLFGAIKEARAKRAHTARPVEKVAVENK